jgi:general secretion pathway protein G
MNVPMENPTLDCQISLNKFACLEHFNRKGCNPRKYRDRRGFTLIEVFIVIAIIGTLSAIAAPNYIRYKYEAMVMVAVTDIKMLEKQIALFVFDNNGQLPNNLSDLTTIGTVRDPWGNPYQYLRIDGGSKNATGKARKEHSSVPVNTDYDLYSMGKDGKSDAPFTETVSQDDVARAYEGRYVGLVSEL